MNEETKRRPTVLSEPPPPSPPPPCKPQAGGKQASGQQYCNECQRTDSSLGSGVSDRRGEGDQGQDTWVRGCNSWSVPVGLLPQTGVSLRPTVGRADGAEQLTVSHTSLHSQHNPCHALWRQPRSHPMRAQGTQK